MAQPTARSSTGTIEVRLPDVTLGALLAVPPDAKGIVVFAHGSGSGRFSPRNRAVADFLFDAGLASLLMDLLTPDEEAIDERTAELRFDIPLLGGRVIGAIDWLAADAAVGDLPPGLRELPVGCFGASTGAAAALIAAAERPDRVRAVVSRGGRPDLAGAGVLRRVTAPTLFIVGARDVEVLHLNRQAAALLAGVKRVEVIPEADHLFTGPHQLERVAELARDWFLQYLV
jgi:pimeloyl-ACP methyl ester carboxylesterase